MSTNIKKNEEILRYFEKKENAQIKNEYELRQNVKSQIIFEKDFVQKNKVCKSNNTLNLSNLNGEELRQKLSTEFYSRTLMESTRCILNTILSDTKGKFNERAKIHEYINSPINFGEQSANGIAIKANLGKDLVNGEIIVLKVPQSPDKSDELIHEAVVGLVLNKLRDSIPNFCYFYDTFSCSSPVVNPDDKKIILWCTTDENAVAYAVFENINMSTPFSDWGKSPFIFPTLTQMTKEALNYTNWDKAIPQKINTLTYDNYSTDKLISEITSYKAQEFILYYLQILLALNIANKKFDFTHYDLHASNVLIRKYSDEVFYIPYEYKGSTKYLLSPGSIATIIDFGMSHVKVDDKDVGILDKTGFFQSSDVYPNKKNIICDAYKLLCFMMNSMLKNKDGDELFEVGTEILSFFYPRLKHDDALVIISTQRDTYYYLPMNMKFNLEDLIDHTLNTLKNNYPLTYKKAFLDNVNEDLKFGCKNACKRVTQIINDIGLTSIAKIPTFFDVYDSRESNKNLEIVNNFVKYTNQSIMNEEVKIKEFLSYNFHKFTAFPSYRDDKDNYNLLIDNYDLLRDSISNFCKDIDIVYEITNELLYIKYILSIYEIDNKDELRRIQKELTLKNKELSQHISLILSDVESGLKTFKKLESKYDDERISTLIKMYETAISSSKR